MQNSLRAVLDIGSNTIRLLIAEVIQDQTFRKIHYQHHIARLGQGLQQTGLLSDEGQQRALIIFKEVILICSTHKVYADEIIAVATAAVREASNGKTFAAKVLKETGLNIQIIDGEVEAKLALAGAELGLPDNIGKDMLLFDIGGGSTEFTRVQNGEIKDSLSLKLGVVRLTESFVKTDPVSKTDYQAMKQAANGSLDKLELFWGEDKSRPRYLVGTAGTVTTLAAILQNMVKYDASKIDGYQMPKDMFYALRDDLLSKTNQQRLEIPALEEGREDVIVAGVAIIDVMFERWGYAALLSVDSGLLMGLLSFPTE
ncbi:MAG: Ppx/GppA phosphatase family protein [Ghiorsea sp.]